MNDMKPGNEHHKKHVATWVAATGTLAVIVALWAMLLPTTLGGMESFGIKDSPSWMVLPEKADDEPTGFQEAFDRSGNLLDRMESDNRARVQREQAAAAANAEAELLRMKIESAAAQPATDADQKPQ